MLKYTIVNPFLSMVLILASMVNPYAQIKPNPRVTRSPHHRPIGIMFPHSQIGPNLPRCTSYTQIQRCHQTKTSFLICLCNSVCMHECALENRKNLTFKGELFLPHNYIYIYSPICNIESNPNYLYLRNDLCLVSTNKLKGIKK